MRYQNTFTCRCILYHMYCYWENGFSFHSILELEGASRSSSYAHWQGRWRNRSPKKWYKWPSVTGPGQHRTPTGVYFLVRFYLCFCLTNRMSPRLIVNTSLCVDTEGLAETSWPKMVCFCRISMLRVCLPLLTLWRSQWDAWVKKYRIKGWKYCYPWTHLITSLMNLFHGAQSRVMVNRNRAYEMDTVFPENREKWDSGTY